MKDTHDRPRVQCSWFDLLCLKVDHKKISYILHYQIQDLHTLHLCCQSDISKTGSITTKSKSRNTG